MNVSSPSGIQALLDEQPISNLQKVVYLLGFFVIALDGMATTAMGYVAPAIATDWRLSVHQLGLVIGAAMIGLGIGAMISGPVADRIGRRNVLLISVFLLGFWTFAAAFAHNAEELIAFRLMAGLGFGAAMPNAGTLVAEYCPTRLRATIVSCVFCGFTFGAAVGGFCIDLLTTHLGWDWRAIFMTAGALPLALVLPLFLLLPDSMQFLHRTQPDGATIRKILTSIAPEHSRSQHFDANAPTGPVTHTSHGSVVSTELRGGSAMLWITYLIGVFMVYLLSGWLPTLSHLIGFNFSQASKIAALFQIGGAVGSVIIGFRMDRGKPHATLAAAYLLGGAFMLICALTYNNMLAMAASSLVAGFALNGANTGMNALAAAFYPSEVRATGVAWMHGIGRIGAVLSAFAPAKLLGLGWSPSGIFSLLAMLALAGTLCIFTKGKLRPPVHLNTVVA